ncbi:hypothetical protein CIK05_04275 [Bdellovibrio sp. qaytius]|nr:hypothetical protein CIK05_04275 [Bdellovibrio sp. qaytius]
MKLFFLICLFVSTAVAAPVTETRVGLFYEIGKKTESQPTTKYLFKQETKVTITDDMNRTSDSTIWDAAGHVLMRETATIDNGVVTSQVMEQLQINEKYVLTVKDDKVLFETFSTKDAKNPKLLDSNSVKLTDNFFTGPGLEIFLKKNLDKLKSQKTVEVDFGIFEFQKSISFDVKQTKKIFKDGPELIPLQMKLSSLLSLFVDPLLFEIDPATAMLVHYRGRTPVRLMKKGKLEPFDGDIYYELKK